jgi:hypothetical protein
MPAGNNVVLLPGCHSGVIAITLFACHKPAKNHLSFPLVWAILAPFWQVGLP